MPSRWQSRQVFLSMLTLCLLAGTPLIAQSPYGLDQRVPMTSSRVVGSPDPPPPFRARRIFPDLEFKEPVHLITEPNSDRLWVTEREGRIYATSDDQQLDTPTLLIEIGRVCYSLCFDPRYADNGYIYVFSNGMIGEKMQNRIARYTMAQATDAMAKPDPATELVILQWESNGHNGHYLQFGPDDKLWISAGDGTTGMDPQLDGQDISNLRGTIIRIDVDGATPNRPYSIPDDNPFVGNANARPEIWAFGFRNPYRFAFDPRTKGLWVADIGQDLWEMIYRVRRGGNYGWSVMEGPQPLNESRPRGPAPIEPPVVAHPHSEMRSITGGFFYRGQRFPELRGSFLYGDYDTRRLFAMRYDNGTDTVLSQKEIATTGHRIISLAEDQDREILILAYTGEILTLDRQLPREAPHEFPRLLSETGLFDDVSQHRAAAGVIEYSVNSPLWSDGATKDRMMAIPGLAKVRYQPHRAWEFPADSVLIKTFSFESEPANPNSRRRVETRLLHQQPQGEWVGYSYRWNDQQTDAELVDADGLDLPLEIFDPAAQDGLRRQVWHFPSRSECMVCHTREARYLLGLTTLQMNRNHDYGQWVDNQLRTLDHIGLFETPLSIDHETLPAMPDPSDLAQPLDNRARSYLHANCAHCHVSDGGGNAALELEYTKTLQQTGLLAAPRQGSMGIERAMVITPRHPERSTLLHRVAHREKGTMPPLASSRVDPLAVDLLTEWIARMEPQAKE